uniref:Uncharacterized protein n=1 Tax=Arundo donax TaxID=35708 RepID=A0A0A8YFX3_ARUDO
MALPPLHSTAPFSSNRICSRRWCTCLRRCSPCAWRWPAGRHLGGATVGGGQEHAGGMATV